MAVIKWRGDAKGVAQVDVRTLTGAPVAGTTWYKISCNGKEIKVTATTNVLADLITAIIAAWNANATQNNAIGEFLEASIAQYDTAKISFTATVPGVPFTFSYSTDGGATTDAADATNSVASAGPRDASIVTNYSSGALPSNGDELWFDDASNGPEFSLSTLSAIDFVKVVFTENFTGRVGRAPRVTIGQTTYIEYRSQYLKLKPTNSSSQIIINSPSQLIRLDTQTFQTTLWVLNTGSGSGGLGGNSGAPTVTWVGTHASNTIIVDRGFVGIAYYPGETANVSSLKLGYITNIDTDSLVHSGVGASITTCNMTGGSLLAEAGLTTLTIRAGSAKVQSGNITTVTVYAGKFSYAGAGTITTATVFPNAEADFFESNQGRTITNTTIYDTATWQDPGTTVVHTNTISNPGGTVTGIKGTFGPGRSSGNSNTISFATA